MVASKQLSPFSRLCLRLAVASVIASAAVGAFALMIPTENFLFEGKILGTTLIISAASVCGLACGGCWSLGRRTLPAVGGAFVGAAALLSLIGLWSEFDEIAFWKLVGVSASLGIGCSHLSMLLLMRLKGTYRWAHLVAYQVILGLAALIAAGIAFEFFDSEGYWRLTGVVSIAMAAVTVIIPVFWWMSRDEAEAEIDEGDPVLRLDERIAHCKKELIELQSQRDALLGRGDGASPAPQGASRGVA